MQPRFFADAAELRDWLERHHADTPELLVGFHKKCSGRPSITWREAVDEALCVVSAKRDETRASRLDTLIRDSADGRRVRPLRRRPTS